MGNEALALRDGAAIQQASEGFGSQAVVRANETSSTAVAAQARAQIEARYIVAMKNPRDWDQVRFKLLKECSRPGFAEVARYSKPVGGSKIEGPSIRFAEAALRCMTNISPSSVVIWDDEDKRIIRVSVTDIESNLTYEQDVVIAKTVERNRLQDGQQALSSRTNSRNQIVYTVRATEDDLLNKQAAQVSKALRTQALRLLPGDILEECMDTVLETQEKRDKADPDAAKKKILDAFAKIGVTPKQLGEYLGHDTAQIVEAELKDLRAVFAAIQQGEATWHEVMATKRPENVSGAQKATDAVKQRLAAKAKPANQQSPAVVETTGASKVTFLAKFSRELAGKPVESADAAARARYLLQVREEIKDLKDNEPEGFEALLKTYELHLVAVEAEDESLRAEGL